MDGNWRFGNWVLMMRNGDAIIANRFSTDGVVVILPHDSQGSIFMQTNFNRELKSIQHPHKVWESKADGTVTRVKCASSKKTSSDHWGLAHFPLIMPNPGEFVDVADELPHEYITHHGFCFNQATDEHGDPIMSISHPLRSAFSVILPAESRGFVYAHVGDRKQLVWSNRNLSDGSFPGVELNVY